MMNSTKVPGKAAFDKDCYETPQWLFYLLNEEFNFIIDACTNGDNSKCVYWLEDAKAEWFYQVTGVFNDCELLTTTNGADPDNIDDLFDKYSIFMNPPYSNPGPFLERAWEFSKYMRVVCLVRDDPSTKWYKKLVSDSREQTIYWNDFINPHYFENNMPYSYEDDPYELTIIRLPKRLKFEINGEPQGTYNFPCCLMIMDRRGTNG